MTSKIPKSSPAYDKNPKTPHEEIMFCVESTNEIVSNLLKHMSNCCKKCPYRDECELEKIDSL